MAAKKKMGAPSKIDKVDFKQAEKLAKAGWTDAQMSDFFGVTEQTWNNWKKKHPDLFESLKDWKDAADNEVERSLYERACGYETTEERIVGNGDDTRVVSANKQYPPDTTACIFWLKNRQPKQWRDKVDHNHTTDFKGDIREIPNAVLAEIITGGSSDTTSTAKGSTNKPH